MDYKTDDLRIRGIEELVPPSMLLRDYAQNESLCNHPVLPLFPNYT